MTGNYGYFLKYTAFAAFLLGLCRRGKKRKRIIFPKIEKAWAQVITCVQQPFSWGRDKIKIPIYNAAFLKTREPGGQGFFLAT